MNKRFACFAVLLFAAIAVSAQADGPRDDATWPPNVSSEEARQHHSLINRLSVATPNEEYGRACKALLDAGIRAFSALVARFNDQGKANEGLVAFVMTRPDGSKKYNNELTIGDRCWFILVGQIEGVVWDKPFPPEEVFDFFPLRQANVQKWLDAHRGSSLLQLQLAARKEALKRAEARLAKEPENKGVSGAVDFFRKEIKRLEAAESAKKSKDSEQAKPAKIAQPR
jgi:hypothetical protein